MILKAFLLAASLMMAVTCFAQEPLTFSKVVQVDSVARGPLFALVNEWFATAYNSANDVIQMTDKEEGTIIGKGLFRYSQGKLMLSCYEGSINYTIKVSVKDNRYKVELTNFKHVKDSGHGPCDLGIISTSDTPPKNGFADRHNDVVWLDIKAKAEAYAKQTIASLEAKTAKGAKSKDDF